MKRVLIIGHSFLDPSMGGVRLRRIARLLPQHGWEPIILTHPCNPVAPVEHPPETRIEEVSAPNLSRLYARLRSLVGKASGAQAAGTKQPKALEIGLSNTLNRWLVIPDKT